MQLEMEEMKNTVKELQQCRQTAVVSNSVVESKQTLLNSSKAHNCAITARAAGSSTQQS